MKTKIFSSLLSFVALGVLWCCSVLSASAQVQVDHYYIISNVSNGKVLSTGGKDAKDAPLVGETLQKTVRASCGNSRSLNQTLLPSTTLLQNWLWTSPLSRIKVHFCGRSM